MYVYIYTNVMTRVASRQSKEYGYSNVFDSKKTIVVVKMQVRAIQVQERLWRVYL
jgi:hypothetical protein